LIQSDAAAVKGVKPSTVVSHLADCIRAGFPVDIERLDVTDAVENLVVDVIRKPPINSGILGFYLMLLIELQFLTVIRLLIIKFLIY